MQKINLWEVFLQNFKFMNVLIGNCRVPVARSFPHHAPLYPLFVSTFKCPCSFQKSNANHSVCCFNEPLSALKFYAVNSNKYLFQNIASLSHGKRSLFYLQVTVLVYGILYWCIFTCSYKSL